MVAANGFDVGDGTDFRFLCCNGGADWPFQLICDKLDSRYPNQKYRAEAFYALAILVNNSEPKNQALYDQMVAQYYRLKESADAESAAGNLTLPQEEQVKIAALTRRAVAVRDRSAIHVDVRPGRARGMVDAVGLAGFVLELAGTARCARGRVVRVRDAAGIARSATAVRDGSPIRVDARPGGARGMVDTVGLACFVLELAITAL